MNSRRLTVLLFVFCVLSLQLSADTNTERLTGADAVAHVEKLQARHNHLRKAANILRDRGYTISDDIQVIRTAESTQSRVQSSVSDAGGEMVFWAWDDGDDSTWEGVIYVEDFATGATATWNAQLDVSTDAFEVLWEQQVGGSGPSDGPNMTSLPDYGRRSNVPQIASMSPTVPVAGNASDSVLVQSTRSVRHWLSCVSAGCGRNVFLMCVFYGPHCVAGACGPGAIRCAIDQLM
ncbi:MAG TPA: hypothetical protein VEU30_13400 [Thermoanaerobaculia bacterium]|nr:hypothetical protein [Thermoanaerobaculia bacterium]